MHLLRSQLASVKQAALSCGTTAMEAMLVMESIVVNTVLYNGY